MDGLDELGQSLNQLVGRFLRGQRLLEQDNESAWLELDPAKDKDAISQILGSSIG